MNKRALFLITLLCSAFMALAQTGLVSGELSVSAFPSNNGDGTFSLSGTFSDPKGLYFASDVAANMSLWKGSNYYKINAASANGAILTLTVEDSYNTGFMGTGVYSIGELTENLNLPGVSTTGDSNPALSTPPDYAAKFNYILRLIDQGIPNAGVVNSVSDTTNITHSVSGDVLIAPDTLVFYVGDQWIDVPIGSGGSDVLVSNGLTDVDPSTEGVDVELGGVLEHDTYITGIPYRLLINKIKDIELSANESLNLAGIIWARLASDSLIIDAGSHLQVVTPDLRNNLSSDGMVLTLLDENTGEVDYRPIASSSVIANNYLYVSQSQGDNSSAQRGSLSHPWADPWAASDAASEGDLIYILDGRWTYSWDGSAAQMQLNGPEISLLDGKSLDFYFAPKTALIHVSAADIPSDDYSVFNVAEGKTVNITGQGSFIGDDNGVIGTVANNSRLLVQMDTLMTSPVDLEDTSWKWSGFSVKNDTSAVLRLEVETVISNFDVVASIVGACDSIEFYTHFKNQEELKSDGSIHFRSASIKNSQLYTQVDRYFGQNPEWYVWSPYRVLFENCTVTAHYDNVYTRGEPYTWNQFFSITNGDHINSHFDIKLNGKGSSRLLRFEVGNGSNSFPHLTTNSSYSFDFDYVVDSLGAGNPLIWLKNPDSTNLHFDLNLVSHDTIDIFGSMNGDWQGAQVTVEGKIKTEGDFIFNAQNISGGTLLLKNFHGLADSLIVNASNAIDVRTCGSNVSQDSVSANVRLIHNCEQKRFLNQDNADYFEIYNSSNSFDLSDLGITAGSIFHNEAEDITGILGVGEDGVLFESSSVLSVYGQGISLVQSNGLFNLSLQDNGVVFYDYRTGANKTGITYDEFPNSNTDFSSLLDNSLVPKLYVDEAINSIKDTIILSIQADLDQLDAGNTPGFTTVPDHLIGAELINVQYALGSAHTGGTIDLQLTDGFVGYAGITMADGDRVESVNVSRILTAEELIQPLRASSSATLQAQRLVVNLTIVK